MARGKDLYIGSTLIPHIYSGEDKVYHIYKDGVEIWRDRRYNKNEVVFESQSTGGSVYLQSGRYEITCVGAGGAAAMRGVYDDRGYGWGGGSGSAFVGEFSITNSAVFNVVVGLANNNTIGQTSNSQTSNPPDMTTHDSSVDGIVVCAGGGSGHYNPNYVGAGGSAPVFAITPDNYTVNTAGNAGSYNSGGKGSAAPAYCAGGASVYNGYGAGQGCRTSEYASKRSWVNGTNGYVKIVYLGDLQN